MNKILGAIGGDRVIWVIVVILSCIGILAVYSASGTLAFSKQHGNTEFYFIRHVVFIVVGLGLTFATHKIPFKFYSRITQIFLWISILLLYYTVFFGATLNNATRVIYIFGISFQPSDAAKLFLVMFIARYLSKKQEEVESWKTLGGILLYILAVVIPVIPENLSTALVIMATSVMMLFIGRIKMAYIIGLITAGLIAFGLFVTFLLNVDLSRFDESSRMHTWKRRIETYIGKDDSGDRNYQQNQSKIAIATGGIFGKGPGHSVQRNYLPHPYSDFIFAIIVEEYGLAGGILVIGCFIVLIFRCLKIVVDSQRSFGALVVLGIGFSMAFQAFIHMGVSVGKFPVTGLTLPLVSMGGSSIAINSIAFGILLGISKHCQEEKLHLSQMAAQTTNPADIHGGQNG